MVFSGLSEVEREMLWVKFLINNFDSRCHMSMMGVGEM